MIRPAAAAVRARRRFASQPPLLMVGLVLLAGGAGTLATLSPKAAVAVAAVPAALLLIVVPGFAIAAAVATVPFAPGVVISAAGLLFSASDLLLVLAGFGAAVLVLRPASRKRLEAFQPLWWWALPFTAWLAFLVILHPSSHVLLKTLQDPELYLLPMLLGAAVLTGRQGALVTGAFLVGAIALAVGWLAVPDNPLLGQKNPAGQFLADAALLALATVSGWRRRLPLLLLLGAGLVVTQSRGAVLGLTLGVLALVAAHHGGRFVAGRRLLAAGVAVTLVSLAALATFGLVPQITAPDVPGVGHTSEYSTMLREAYRSDAIGLIAAHPLDGVGVGEFLTGGGTFASAVDPHNVVLRTAGDTGLPGLCLFVLMVAGTSMAAWRRRQFNRYAAVALAIQVSILTHALVDVYWARGTPVIGWLLVGMAFNPAFDRPPAQPATAPS